MPVAAIVYASGYCLSCKQARYTVAKLGCMITPLLQSYLPDPAVHHTAAAHLSCLCIQGDKHICFVTASAQQVMSHMVRGGRQLGAMGAGQEGVQYNTARTLRHLALGSQAAHKKAALPAVVPLTQALQVSHTLAILKASCAPFCSRLAGCHAWTPVQVYTDMHGSTYICGPHG